MPSIDDVAASMAAPQPADWRIVEALLRHTIELYEQGGQQIYDLATGQLSRDFPEDLLSRASSGNKEERMQMFAGWWRMHHTPTLIARWRKASAAASQYPGFRDLAVTPLFAATSKEQQDILLLSIVRTFSLGGELQVDYLTPMRNWVRRKCAHGECYETIEHFIDILRKNRGTSAYKKAVDEILHNPDARYQIERLADLLSHS